jgi:hypothetical protein
MVICDVTETTNVRPVGTDLTRHQVAHTTRDCGLRAEAGRSSSPICGPELIRLRRHRPAQSEFGEPVEVARMRLVIDI